MKALLLAAGLLIGVGRAEASSLRSLAAATAERYGLDVAVVSAVVQAESDWNPDARSPKGAMGLMQLMPGTARDLGVEDPYDPAQSLEGGCRYLRQLLDEFGELPLALAAYNAGPEHVRRAGGIPSFEETRTYVVKVLGAAGTRLTAPRLPVSRSMVVALAPTADRPSGATSMLLNLGRKP